MTLYTLLTGIICLWLAWHVFSCIQARTLEVRKKEPDESYLKGLRKETKLTSYIFLTAFVLYLHSLGFL